MGGSACGHYQDITEEEVVDAPPEGQPIDMDWENIPSNGSGLRPPPHVVFFGCFSVFMFFMMCRL
jgi:hypothetical protein